MRVLHFATSSKGGAGIAAIRLHEGLRNLGVDSVFVCRENLHEYVESRPFSRLAPTILSKSLSFVQIPGRLSKGSLVTPFEIDYLYPHLRKIEIEAFDVVHIHAPFNFVGEESIKEITYRSKGKIFITLHDERFFTGGCHYSEECRKFEDKCQQCPQVKKVFQHSVAREQLRAKELFSEDLFGDKCIFIAPSKWIAEEASRSTILRNAQVEIIPNGIPKIFFDAAANRKSKRRVVGFSSFNLHNPYKGFEYLVKAMRQINSGRDQDFQLCLLGSGKVSKENFLIEQRIANSDSEVIDFLHQIDVLAVPSLHDNLPSVVLEALAVGVPVVGTSVGGIAEMLELCQMPKVQSKDQLSLAEAILKILESNQRYPSIQMSRIIEKKFAIEVVAKDLLEIYLKK